MIRTILLSIFLFGSTLFSKPIDLHCTPYLYGDLTNFGYGVSIRLEIVRYNFEVAPFFAPHADHFLASHDKEWGATCSYYYTFFKKRSFRPYCGLSYTFIQEKYDPSWLNVNFSDPFYQSAEEYSISFDTIHTCSTLIGLQFCPRNSSFYCFVDLLGPIDLFDAKKIKSYLRRPPYNNTLDKATDTIKEWFSTKTPIPRCGVGLSF